MYKTVECLRQEKHLPQGKCLIHGDICTPTPSLPLWQDHEWEEWRARVVHPLFPHGRITAHDPAGMEQWEKWGWAAPTMKVAFRGENSVLFTEKYGTFVCSTCRLFEES